MDKRKLSSTKDRAAHRIKIIRGHLNKIEKMIVDDEYCVDIVHQSRAVQSALKKLDLLLIEDHLNHCVVHQIKNNEEEIKYLRQKNELDQQQIKSLNTLIAELSKRLSDSESLKSHFISNISNELVNPFTSVLALTENILNVDKENWKKVISMISLMHTEVFNLDFQLKNIFAAAKFEAGETIPEISLVNIDQCIIDTIKYFKYEARRKKVSIKCLSQHENIPVYFKTDKEKFELLISNLISNAIKFSYPQSEVLIKINISEKELITEVVDFGEGISQKNQKVVFDRFKRSEDGISSINRGHGLGLSVNKAIIDILNGKISFTTELEKGTTFKIMIPEPSEKTKGEELFGEDIFFKEEKF